MNFRGKAYHQLDEKSRARIPSKFFPVSADGSLPDEKDDRSGVAFSLVVGAQGFLSVYLTDVLEQKLDVLMREDPKDLEEARARRKIRASIEDVVTDRQGRIVIPPHLRAAASFNKELVSIGAGDHFEIWAKELYEKEDKEITAGAAYAKLGVYI